MSPSPATWQEAARGIPVWEGCLATDGDGDSWRILEADNHDYVARIRHPWCGNVHEGCHPDLILDLTDPDTRAAYIRRLAVALGCPEAVASEGVRFYITEGCGPQIDAGYNEDDILTNAWRLDLRDLGSDALTNATDRLQALALAWPADKRGRP